MSRDTLRTDDVGTRPRSTDTAPTWTDRVNPVTRLAGAMVLTFPLLITLDWVSAVAAICVEVAVWYALGPWDARRLRVLALRALPFMVAAPVAGVSLALYGSPGGTTFFSWGLIHVSGQSVSYGAAVAARVVALGVACLVTLSGIDPTDMADGLAQVWRLPARFVLGTVAGIRLIASLAEDQRSMRMARRARGLGDHRAVRRFVTVAFALLVSAIRRGSTLATAMEARGFGRGARTWARPSRVGAPDLVYLLGTAAIVVAALVISLVTGHFRWIGSVM
ncbi:MAG: energy-coupling factor transporter transmembrane protein EcfT [Propionibacteriaceae bacterium]|nr:energy-coupling factor transporter transmembrane protein EcfT [Propionibacteriaceae bacterium]